MRGWRVKSGRRSRGKRARSMRPVAASGILAVGLVCAAAFTGITVQAHAQDRLVAVYKAELAKEEVRNAGLLESIAHKKTVDYLIEKAQDYDFVRQGEGLIAVERSAPVSSAPAADGGRASRVLRWVQLFFAPR